MAKLSPQGPFRALNANGEPLDGGLLYTYEAGTSTPKDTYTDESGDTKNTNPVELDDRGYADVWLGDGSYKFILTDSAGVTQWTIDDVVGDASEGFASAVIDQATNLVLSTGYEGNFINATAAITISLLSASEAGEGFYFTAKASGGAIIIDPDGSETIDGGSTYTIAQGSSALIICNGTEWYTAFDTPIATGSVTNAMLANMAANTIKANATAGAAAPQDVAVAANSVVLRAGGNLTTQALTASQILGRGSTGDIAPLATTNGVTITGTNILLASGTIVNRAYAESTTYQTIAGTSQIPYDNTLPQVGEGDQVLTAAITPKTTTNRIRATFMCFFTVGASNVQGSAAMFVNGGANAVQATSQNSANGGLTAEQLVMTYEYAPGSISAQTISVRAGPSQNFTMYINGTSSAQLFGGAARATLVLEEIVA